jgi:hypothetical protein
MTRPTRALLHTVLPATLLFIAFGIFIGGARRADAEGSVPKNLQVLPKTMTRDQVKGVMKMLSKELGVECDHCHEVPDMASDKLEHKKIAREMMKMMDELNRKWIAKVAPKAEVTCNTCHRGHEKPEP